MYQDWIKYWCFGRARNFFNKNEQHTKHPSLNMQKYSKGFNNFFLMSFLIFRLSNNPPNTWSRLVHFLLPQLTAWPVPWDSKYSLNKKSFIFCKMNIFLLQCVCVDIAISNRDTLDVKWEEITEDTLENIFIIWWRLLSYITVFQWRSW